MILPGARRAHLRGSAGEIDAIREMCLRVMPMSLDLVVPLKIDIKTGTNWGELESPAVPSLPKKKPN